MVLPEPTGPPTPIRTALRALLLDMRSGDEKPLIGALVSHACDFEQWIKASGACTLDMQGGFDDSRREPNGVPQRKLTHRSGPNPEELQCGPRRWN
jgi:hypothetical protein